MGHGGRPWQLQSNCLYKTKEKEGKRKKKKKEKRREEKIGNTTLH